MEQSKLVPVIIGFVVLEAINTVVNILPARKQKTEAGRKRYFIRAGIVNLVLIAGLVAYFLLKK